MIHKYVATVVLLTAVYAFSLVTAAPEPQKQPAKAQVKRALGHKPPTKEVSESRHKASNARHAERLQAIQRVTADSFDCVAMGWVPPIKDQGQCGDCYVFSGVGTSNCAFIKSNYGKPDGSFVFSEQHILDCYPNLGGCDGGDEWEVAQTIMQHGVYTVNVYSGAGQKPGGCKSVKGTLYKIADMGYCDVNQAANGVASTQSIKDCMVKFGPISVAVAAGGWSDPGSTIITAKDSNVDHAVILVGWKTGTNGKTIWKMRNSWTVDWGVQGYAWIEEGACSVGTEAFWVTATPLPPVPPPQPPVPPVPPTPVGPVTITLTAEQVQAVLQQAGNPPAGVTITTSTTLGELLDLLKKK